MKVGKLDLSYKMMELHKQLSTMATIVTVHGDIILDDELQALVYMALRPVLEKRLKTGALAPVFVNGEFIQDGTEKQIDPVEEIDREYTAGAGEIDKPAQEEVDRAVDQMAAHFNIDGKRKSKKGEPALVAPFEKA